MAASVETQILVKIKALIEGLPQVEAFSAALKGIKSGSGSTSGLDAIGKSAKNAGTQSLFAATSLRVLGAAATPLIGIGRVIGSVFASMARQIQFAVAALGIFILASPALAFAALVKEGLSFNSVMEQQKIGLAALIQSTNNLFHKDQPNKPLEGLQAYEAATQLAKESTDRLSVKLIPLKATLEDLLPIFNQIVTAGAAAGLSLQQTETVFVDLAAVAQVVNIPLEKLGTGIRLTLNGTARATTVLATALFGSATAANAWVKEHKKIGDLADALHAKLEPFRLALITSESSFATLGQNTKDVFQRLAGIATSGLFERIKQGFVQILQSFYDLKKLDVKPEFQALLDLINGILTKAGDLLVDLVTKIINGLQDIAKYVQDNRAYVEQVLGDLISIGQQVFGILGDLFSIVGELDNARGQTASWHAILGGAAITVGAIRDLFNILIGLIQTLSGTIVAGMLYPLEDVLKVLGLVSSTAAAAAESIASVRKGYLNYAESGAVKFASGVASEHGLEAAGNFLNGGTTFSQRFGGKPGASDIINRLKPGVGGGAKKSGGGSGGKGDQQAADKLAESLRQLRDSTLGLTLTKFEERIAHVKFLLDQGKNALDRELKDHLISITDYYRTRLDIEKNALNADIVQQQAQREHDTEKINDKIAELEGKRAALAKNTKLSPGARADSRKAFDNQIQAERNKLKEVEIKSDEKIAELTGQITAAEFNSFQDQKFALRELNDAIDEVSNTVSDVNNRTAEAAANRLDKQFRDLLAQTEQNFGANSTELNLLNGYIEFYKSKAKVDQKLDEFATRDQANQAAIGRAQTDLNQGKITQIEYEQQVNALNVQYKEDQLVILDAAIEIAKATGATADQLQRLQQARDALASTAVAVDSLAQNINGTLRDAAGSFFDTMLEGNTGLLENFRKTVSQMLIQMAKLIFQAVIMSAIFKALGIGAGSTGGAGGFLTSLFGGGPAKHAEGGIMEGPGTSMSDSIPAMLSHGEGVIPASSVSRYGRGMIQSIINGSFVPGFGRMHFAVGGFAGSTSSGGGSGAGTRVVNVLDPNLLEDYVNSATGEKVLLNVISRNPNKIRQILGVA